ncbi:hypothetical protein C8R42DRAFT_95315 [Lentinula raphanica]|nr:hypothetical protein C8R42DRAFT_95315 [Lentinula raphanica]
MYTAMVISLLALERVACASPYRMLYNYGLITLNPMSSIINRHIARLNSSLCGEIACGNQRNLEDLNNSTW